MIESFQKRAHDLAADVMQVHLEWLTGRVGEASLGSLADESRPTMQRIITKAIEMAMKEAACHALQECVEIVRANQAKEAVSARAQVMAEIIARSNL